MKIENVVKKIKDNRELIRPYYHGAPCDFDVHIEDGDVESENITRGDITLYIYTAWKTKEKKKLESLSKRIKSVFKAKTVSFCDVNSEKNEPFFWVITLRKEAKTK